MATFIGVIYFSWEHLMEGTCGAVKNRFPFVSLLSASVAVAWSSAASVTPRQSRNAFSSENRRVGGSLLLCDSWGEKQVGLLCIWEFSAIVPAVHPLAFSCVSYEVSMSSRLFSFLVCLVRSRKLTRYFSTDKHLKNCGLQIETSQLKILIKNRR